MEEDATKGIYGDTYPMAWAADGEIYMSFGDGLSSFYKTLSTTHLGLT